MAKPLLSACPSGQALFSVSAFPDIIFKKVDKTENNASNSVKGGEQQWSW